MEKFSVVDSVAAPLDRVNVDTDQIIPKQFLRSISRAGFGPFLFDEWRYADRGELGMDCERRERNPDFVLNDPRFANAQILLAQDNFGCGSSREHAVWALMEYGFRAVVAPSFGDIFANNALKNGMLPVTLPADAIAQLFTRARAETLRLTVDLPAQQVAVAGGGEWPFDIAPDQKRSLLEGLDDIALSLQYADDIRAYEARRRAQEPWVFAEHRL